MYTCINGLHLNAQSDALCINYNFPCVATAIGRPFRCRGSQLRERVLDQIQSGPPCF